MRRQKRAIGFPSASDMRCGTGEGDAVSQSKSLMSVCIRSKHRRKVLRKNGSNGGGAMNAEVYLQINFIPIIALVLMRLNTERTLTYSWRSRALRFMMVLLTGVMLLNLAGRCLDGQQFAGAHVLLLLLDHGSLMLLVFLSYLWYLYVCDVLNHGIDSGACPY